MTRVSENSQSASLQYSVAKAKSKMEDLQLKGANLKKLSKPSDNPIANVEALEINSRTSENNQYVKNSDLATMYLNITEKSLEELTEVLTKAKEIAIAQSSDFYDGDIRKNVANEIIQLRNLALSIANKRVGNKYIFSGYKTLTRPFDDKGEYNGDKNHIRIEVAKDFFVPINLHGEEVFFSDDIIEPPQTDVENLFKDEAPLDRTPAATSNVVFQKRENLFSLMSSLVAGLDNDDPKLIQNLLEKFDGAISRLITLRTRVGSIANSIETTKSKIESDTLDGVARRSKLVDADVAELFSDITKQQSVLATTYKAGHTMLNQSLMDFLR